MVDSREGGTMVEGQGDPGDPRGRILSIQGVPGGSPIPVSPIPTTPGTPFFADSFADRGGGSYDNVILFTVPGGVTRSLQRLVLDCRFEAQAIIRADGSEIGSIRSGPDQPTSTFLWSPARPILPGQTISIHLDVRSPAPATSIGLWLQGLDI